MSSAMDMVSSAMDMMTSASMAMATPISTGMAISGMNMSPTDTGMAGMASSTAAAGGMGGMDMGGMDMGGGCKISVSSLPSSLSLYD
jgi:hypothetical protein